jgi:hypothetical protein
MRANEFFKIFNELPQAERYKIIRYEAQPTSFFVIFQKLSEVRKQIKRLEEQEEHLLAQAEEELNK